MRARQLHQLWVDKSFFLRCPDAPRFTALEGRIAVTMKKAGDKIGDPLKKSASRPAAVSLRGRWPGGRPKA
jgi:hypothetical protein